MECNDQNWRCLFWSIPELGYCNLYAEIRFKICRQSCGACQNIKNINIENLLVTSNNEISKSTIDTINDEEVSQNLQNSGKFVH